MPLMICGGAVGGDAANCRNETISGNAGGTAPRSTAMSTCSSTQSLHHARVKAKRIIIMAAVLLLLVGAIALWPRDNEPSYRGKTLSQWIDSCEPQVGATTAIRYASIYPQEFEAIRAIGTNALPCLLEWIRYQPSKPKEFLYPLLGRLRIMSDPSKLRANRVAVGFAMLGALASPAIPELKKIANAATDRKGSEPAIYALECIGSPALPALAEVIRSTNAAVRFEAVKAVCYSRSAFGTNAYPILIDCLDDPDATIALEAALALVRAGAEPAIVCSKITRQFQHPDWWQRNGAIQTVGMYQGNAREQVRTLIPDLVAALADANPQVRESAETVLRSVAPEVLTNAPAK